MILKNLMAIAVFILILSGTMYFTSYSPGRDHNSNPVYQHEKVTKITMEMVTSKDGTEIALEQTGSGPPLVLVHGATLDRAFWDLAGVRLKLEEHFTVYAIDRRARGGSGNSDKYALEREFEDVAAVVQSIDEPVTLLGHSAGAFYSLEAALRTSNLERLILYEPPMPLNGYRVGSKADRAEIISLLEADEYEHAYILFLEKIARWTDQEIDSLRTAPMWQEYVERFPVLLPMYRKIALYEFHPERFSDLTIPVLLFSGSESGRWAFEITKTLDDVLPNSQIITFAGHGHSAMLTAAERFTGKILTFSYEPDQ